MQIIDLTNLQLYETGGIILGVWPALWGLFQQISGSRLFRQANYPLLQQTNSDRQKEEQAPATEQAPTTERALTERALTEQALTERALIELLEACWAARGVFSSFCAALAISLLAFSELRSFSTHLTLLMIGLALLLMALQSLVTSRRCAGSLVREGKILRWGALADLLFALYLLAGTFTILPF